MPERDEMLARYKRLREVGRSLGSKLVRAIPKPTLKECARKLGFLADGDVFVFDSEDETAILMDYAIHSHRAGGKTVLEWYVAAEHPPADADEAALLQASRNARFSIYSVERVDKGLGVEVEDAFARDRMFVVDIGFSETGVKGLALAARLVPLPDFYISTGAALPVLPGLLPELERRIVTRFGLARAQNLKNLSPNEQSALATIVIQTCLRGGASRHVRYDERVLR